MSKKIAQNRQISPTEPHYTLVYLLKINIFSSLLEKRRPSSTAAFQINQLYGVIL